MNRHCGLMRMDLKKNKLMLATLVTLAMGVQADAAVMQDEDASIREENLLTSLGTGSELERNIASATYYYNSDCGTLEINNENSFDKETTEKSLTTNKKGIVTGAAAETPTLTELHNNGEIIPESNPETIYPESAYTLNPISSPDDARFLYTTYELNDDKTLVPQYYNLNISGDDPEEAYYYYTEKRLKHYAWDKDTKNNIVLKEVKLVTDEYGYIIDYTNVPDMDLTMLFGHDDYDWSNPINWREVLQWGEDIDRRVFQGSDYTFNGEGYGGAIYNENYVNDIKADFINNHISSSEYQGYATLLGGAIANGGPNRYYSSASINNIIGDFVDNYVSYDTTRINGQTITGGGAIFNGWTIGNIEGKFFGNSSNIIFQQLDNNPPITSNGGAIYNAGKIENITGDFIDNHTIIDATIDDNYYYYGYDYSFGVRSSGGAIYNDSDDLRSSQSASIGNIIGSFINNYALMEINDTASDYNNSKSEYVFGGAISNTNQSEIKNIVADFINNHAIAEVHFSNDYAFEVNNVWGGAIYNESSIENITGDFIGNYVAALNDSAKGIFVGKIQGGAIYNGRLDYSGSTGGTSIIRNIKSIIGNFIGNYALMNTNCISSEENNINGGAIYNGRGKINEISGDFTENHVSFIAELSGGASRNYYGGGAIYNEGNIQYIHGNFTNNYVDSTITEENIDGGYINISTDGGAIYNAGGTIDDIKGDFINNYVSSTVTSHNLPDTGSNASGGAIAGSAKNITGNFISNHASAILTLTTDSDFDYTSNHVNALGGAIYNLVGNISGNFIKNYASAVSTNTGSSSIKNEATGGAIIIYDTTYNKNITGDFINNYASAVLTNTGASSSISNVASGGAIYNSGTITENITDKQTFTVNKYIATNGTTGETITYWDKSDKTNINNYLSQGKKLIISEYTRNSTVPETSQNSWQTSWQSIQNNIANGTYITEDPTSDLTYNDYWHAEGGLVNTSFTGNYAKASGNDNSTAYGGAIHNIGTIGEITGDGFTDNYALAISDYAKGIGGAIFNEGTIGSIIGGFTNNYALATGTETIGWGGAIYNNGTITIKDSSFTGNAATTDGGAIYNDNTINLIADSANVTFSDNKIGVTPVFDADDKVTGVTGGTLNDIYNGGILNLSAKEGKNISFTGTITDADTPAGTTTIGGTYDDNGTTKTYTGAVNFGNDITQRTININSGTVNASGKYNATDSSIASDGTLKVGASNLNVTNGLKNAGVLNLEGGTLSTAVTNNTTNGRINVLDTVNVANTISANTLNINNNTVNVTSTGVLDLAGLINGTDGGTINAINSHLDTINVGNMNLGSNISYAIDVDVNATGNKADYIDGSVTDGSKSLLITAISLMSSVPVTQEIKIASNDIKNYVNTNLTYITNDSGVNYGVNYAAKDDGGYLTLGYYTLSDAIKDTADERYYTLTEDENSPLGTEGGTNSSLTVYGNNHAINSQGAWMITTGTDNSVTLNDVGKYSVVKEDGKLVLDENGNPQISVINKGFNGSTAPIAFSGKDLNINNSVFTENTGTAAIFSSGTGSNVNIKDSLFTNNNVGIYIPSGSTNLNIENSYFTNNTGKSIQFAGTGALSISDTLFVNNRDYPLHITGNPTTATIENTDFIKNTAGGIIIQHGGLEKISGNFIENYIDDGGAIVMDLGTSAKLIEGNFDKNYSDGAAGAIYLNSARVTNIKGNFTNNHAAYAGGAIYSIQLSQIGEIEGNFTNNYVEGNRAYGGGALYIANTPINKIKGNFENNHIIISYEGSNTTAYGEHARGGAIALENSSNIQQGIDGYFKNNYIEATKDGNAWGGALYIYGTKLSDEITGVIQNNHVKTNTGTAFGGAVALNASANIETSTLKSMTDNYAESTNGDAYGGALYNNSSYLNGSISGDLTRNHVSAGGDAHGGAIAEDGARAIDDIDGSVTENYATSTGKSAYGGAIYTRTSSGSRTITGNITNNYASAKTDAMGGAIYLNSARITNIAGNVSSNHAIATDGNAYGGAIYNTGYSGSRIDSISGNVSDNYAKSTNGDAYGGAIYIYGASGNTAITGNITNNYAISSNASAYGGAICYYNVSISPLYNKYTNNFVEGKTNSYGGAIYAVNGGININNDLTGNYANSTEGNAYGGALYFENMYITLTDIDVKDNAAKTQGGAIYGNGGSLTINANTKDVEFSGNKVGVTFSHEGEKITGFSGGSTNDIQLNNSTLQLNTTNDHTIKFAGSVVGSGSPYFVTRGSVEFDNTVSGANLVLNSGSNVKLGSYGTGTDKTYGSLNLSGLSGGSARIDAINGGIQNNILGNMSGSNFLYSIDVDLNGTQADTVESSNKLTSGSILLDSIKLTSDSSTKYTKVRVSDANLSEIMGLKDDYTLDYTGLNGTYSVFDTAMDANGWYLILNKNDLHNLITEIRDYDRLSTTYTLQGNESISTDFTNLGDFDGDKTKIGALSGDNVNFTIDGNGYSIDGDGKGGITVARGQTLNIQNVGAFTRDANTGEITITNNGFNGFGDNQRIIDSNGNLNIKDTVFSNNNDTTSGYAMIGLNGGTASLDNVVISNNTRTTDLIRNDKGANITKISGDIINNHIENNNSFLYGGVIYNSNSTIGTIDALFEGNYAQSYGVLRGLAIQNDGTRGTIETIKGSFKNNYSKSESGIAGGIIYNGSRGNIETIDAIFENNYSKGYSTQGGAIHNRSTIGTIIGDFTNNYALAIGDGAEGQGGAIFNMGGTITIKDSSFTGNAATTDGGAIYNYAKTIDIIADSANIPFSDNKIGVTPVFDADGKVTGVTGGTLNDIYNRGILNLSAKEGKNISFTGTITDASTPAGTTTIGGTYDDNGTTKTYTGAVNFGNDITQKTININSGTVNASGKYNATDSSITSDGTLKVGASNLNVTNGLKNAGVLNLEGGTLSTAVTNNTTNGRINVLDTVNVANTISANTLNVNNNTVNVTSTGVLDLVGLTNSAGGGLINTQNNKIDESIKLGEVTLNGELKLAVDVALQGTTPTSDFFEATSLDRGSENYGILINSIKVLSDSDPTAIPTNVKVVNNVLKEATHLSNEHISIEGASVNRSYMVTYAKLNDGGYLTFDYGKLYEAVHNPVAERQYNMFEDEAVITQSTYGSMEGANSTLTVNANGYSINGGSKGGITIANGMTLNINDANGSNTTASNKGINGFTTALTNKGNLNISNTVFSNNTKDIDNDGTLTFSGTNSIGKIVSGDGSAEIKSGTTTVANNAKFEQKKGSLQIDKTATFDNDGDTTVKDLSIDADSSNKGKLDNSSSFSVSGTVNNKGIIDNNGTSSNKSEFEFKGTTFTNSGTINNKEYGKLTINNSSANIANSGTVNNDGQFTISKGSVNNTGSILGSGDLQNKDSLTNANRIEQGSITNNGGTLLNNGTIKVASLTNSNNGKITTNANNLNVTGGSIDNKATLEFTGGTINTKVTGANGITSILAGSSSVTIASTIEKNTLRLDSGTAKLGTTGNINSIAGLVANGGALDIANSQVDDVKLGDVVLNLDLSLSIDAYLAGENPTIDHLSANSINANGHTIYIDQINIRNDATKSMPIVKEVADEILRNSIKLGNNAKNVNTAKESYLITYSTGTGELTFGYMTLQGAIASDVEQKVYNMSSEHDETVSGNLGTLNGNSLVVNGNGKAIIGTDNPVAQGVIVNSGKELTFSNVSDFKGFDTAIENKTGGIINIDGVTFGTNKSEDIKNAGTANFTGNNTIATKVTGKGTSNIKSGKTSVNSGKDFTQDVINISNGATLDNNGGTVTANATLDNAGKIKNDGKLNFKGSTFTNETTGTIANGTSGSIDLNGANNSVISNKGSIENDGNISIKKGTLTNEGTITGNGTIENKAALINKTSIEQNEIKNNGGTLTNEGTITTDKLSNSNGGVLTSNASNLIVSNNKIENKATLELTGGENNNAISGSGGTTNFSGTTKNNAEIKQNVTNSGKLTNTTNGAITGDVENKPSAEFENNARITGNVINNGEFINNAKITGSITNSGSGAQFTTNANNIGTGVNNNTNADFTITGGEVSVAITGDNTGTVHFDSTNGVTVNSSISNNSISLDKGSTKLTTSASLNGINTIANGGALDLQNNSVADNINLGRVTLNENLSLAIDASLSSVGSNVPTVDKISGEYDTNSTDGKNIVINSIKILTDATDETPIDIQFASGSIKDHIELGNGRVVGADTSKNYIVTYNEVDNSGKLRFRFGDLYTAVKTDAEQRSYTMNSDETDDKNYGVMAHDNSKLTINGNGYNVNGTNSADSNIHHNGIEVKEGQTLVVKDVNGSNSSEKGFNGFSSAFGGALHNDGTLLVDNSKFSDNQSGYGGAVFNNGYAEISNTSFANNEVSGFGGAIHNNGNAKLKDTNNSYTNNKAAWGGALFNENGYTISEGSTFKNNSATNLDEGGGAIWNAEGTITLNNADIEANSANTGSALYNKTGNATIIDSIVKDNTTTANNGAAIYNGNILNIISQDNNTNIADTKNAIDNRGTLNLNASDTHEVDINGNIIGNGDINVNTEYNYFNGFDNDNEPTTTPAPTKGKIVLNGNTNANNINIASGTLDNNGTINAKDINNSDKLDNKDGKIISDKLTNNNNGSIVSNASDLTITDFTNNGALELNGGTNTNTIKGSGETTISASVTNEGSITQDKLTNNSILTNTGELSINKSFDNSNGTLLNNSNGSLNLNGDNISIDGTIVNSEGANINVNATNAANNTNIYNDGIVTIAETSTFENNNSITGNGTFTNKGTTNNDGLIKAQTINNEGTLTTNISNLSGSVTNTGDIHFNDTTNAATKYDISGSGTVHLDSSAITVVNHNLNGNTLSLNNGTLIFGNNKDISEGGFIANGGRIEATDGAMNQYNLGDVNVTGTTNINLDFDLTSETSDKFNGNYTGNGTLFVDNIRVQGNTLKDSVHLHLSDLTGIDTSVLASRDQELPTILTPIRYLKGNLENNYINYVGTGNKVKDYNPAIFASPVATLVGGYLTQSQTMQDAFFHMNRYTKYSRSSRLAAENLNKFASSDVTSIPTYLRNTLPETETANWVKPYTTFEKVNLNGGIGVSNITYGTLYGGDSKLTDLGRGYKGVISAFIGYNGSHSAYNGIDMNQQGGSLGVTGTLYKGNFFTGLTVSAGAAAGEAYTPYGTDQFAMFTAGVANKTGYNFEFKQGKFIIQPSMFLGYSFVNTFDYTNAAGARIKSDPLNAIQIAPGVKFIGNLKNGWQPYAGVDMVWNIMGRTHFVAQDSTLPNLSVKPYIQYGVGVQKSWGDRFTAFAQTMIRNGGRNGIVLQGGFRWAIGKDYQKTPDYKIKSDPKVLPEMPESIKKELKEKRQLIYEGPTKASKSKKQFKIVTRMDGSNDVVKEIHNNKKVIGNLSSQKTTITNKNVVLNKI